MVQELFLLSACEALFEHHLSWYLANEPRGHIGQRIYEASGGQWRLTLQEKRRILSRHIRGVDVDSNAVEVTRFSLLLKLIEGETAEALQDYVATHGEPALPTLQRVIISGNSLVSHGEWAAALGNIPAELARKVNPLTWATEFPNEMGSSGV